MSAQTKGFFEPNSNTGCQCSIPDGEASVFCDRHKCLKSKHMHSLCQRNPKYFAMWERGEGPNQEHPALSIKDDKKVTMPTAELLSLESGNNMTGFFWGRKSARARKRVF